MKRHNISLFLFLIVFGITALPANAIVLTYVVVGHIGNKGFVYGHYDSFSADNEVLCKILLPICVLSSSNRAHQINEAVLIENGYSKSQVDKILRDQSIIALKLKSKNLKIKLEGNESATEVVNVLRRLHPKVSKEYLSFFVSMSALNGNI